LAIYSFEHMDNGFKVLSEGEVATERVWIERFGGDARLFSELLANGILRNSGLSRSGKKFTFNFVGLLSTAKVTWFSFPKASKARHESDAAVVLRAIVEYRHKVARASTSFDFSETADRFYDGSLVDTFSSLVLWTLDHGFHHEFIDESRSIHEGIDWGRTINSTLALHSAASVVYPFPVTRIQSSKLSDLAKLQAYALLEMRRQLGAFATIIASDVEDLWERCLDVLDFSLVVLNHDIIGEIIDSYAESTNRDEDIELIGLLSDWHQENWSSGIKVSAYGLSSFHTVWEDMCAHAISALGQRVSHDEVASQPSYFVAGCEFTLTPQRPDILLKRDDSIILADAKWYLLDERMLPQTPDAIKQFAYELSVFADTRIDANLLLLPTEAQDMWGIVGVLQMGSASGRDERFQPVSIIAFNWRYLAKIYIERRRLPEQFMVDMVALRSNADL
jgi:hypothetical protein